MLDQRRRHKSHKNDYQPAHFSSKEVIIIAFLSFFKAFTQNQTHIGRTSRVCWNPAKIENFIYT